MKFPRFQQWNDAKTLPQYVCIPPWGCNAKIENFPERSALNITFIYRCGQIFNKSSRERSILHRIFHIQNTAPSPHSGQNTLRATVHTTINATMPQASAGLRKNRFSRESYAVNAAAAYSSNSGPSTKSAAL